MKLYRTTDFQVRRKSRRTRMSVVHRVDFYLPLALAIIMVINVGFGDFKSSGLASESAAEDSRVTRADWDDLSPSGKEPLFATEHGSRSRPHQ